MPIVEVFLAFTCVVSVLMGTTYLMHARLSFRLRYRRSTPPEAWPEQLQRLRELSLRALPDLDRIVAVPPARFGPGELQETSPPIDLLGSDVPDEPFQPGLRRPRRVARERVSGERPEQHGSTIEVDFQVEAAAISSRVPAEFMDMRDEIDDAIRDGLADADRDRRSWTRKNRGELRLMRLRSLFRRAMEMLALRRA